MPPNLTEDKIRRKSILDVLLAFSIIIFIIINIIRVIDHFTQTNDQGLPLWSTLLILVILICLVGLSRRGKIKTASIVLISLYALPMIFCLIFWGADLPAGLLLAVLIITLSVALLGAKAAFLVTFLVSGLLISLTWLQNNSVLEVQSYWRQGYNQIGDAISYSILLLISASIAWLFAHGTEQSLIRARRSEFALKEERDSLEIKVQERTKELRRVEQEKVNQLYRLAEFGKLSSGIFHDLMNPLTAVSLNLGQIKNESENKYSSLLEISHAKLHLQQAISAANRMEGLISGVRKQIQKESVSTTFSLNEEISEIIQILGFKARKANVCINFLAAEDIIFTGDAIKFGQIIINLLANAIDASEDSPEAQSIEIALNRRHADIEVVVKDWGAGIASENMEKIFEHYFSTKTKSGQGLGIGLAMTKNIVEKTFDGTISVTSEPGNGAVFTVMWPYKPGQKLH